MKQIYHPFNKWECYKNGMWNKVDKLTESKMLVDAIEFTGNHLLYGNSMLDVVDVWEYSLENFLSNLSINRRAYIGHCAVSYELKIPEYITRMAWKELSEQQQILANKQADNTIRKWEQKQKLKNTLRTGKKDVIQMEFLMKHQ
jgi:hypothetical protein